MSEEWAVGDDALCIDDTELFRQCLTKGRFYKVSSVTSGSIQGVSVVALILVGLGHYGKFDAARFVKITPHTPDAEDEITIRLMREKPAIRPVNGQTKVYLNGKPYIRDAKTGHWVPQEYKTRRIGWTDE